VEQRRASNRRGITFIALAVVTATLAGGGLPVDADTPVSPTDTTVEEPTDTTVEEPTDTTVEEPTDTTVADEPTDTTVADEPAEVISTPVLDASTDPFVDEIATAIDASATDTARVIVTTKLATVPETALSDAEVVGQRAAIDESLGGIEDVIADTDSRVVSELDVVPSAVVEVDAAGLDALLADPSVESVRLDQMGTVALGSSTRVIHSDWLNSTGVLGNNYEGSPGRFEVVVIDTGVARLHRAFSGRVVSEACFSNARACPNRRTRQLGRGAAVPCKFSSDCFHGTHVAGTAAGNRFGGGGHEGVAPRAGIVAIRIGQNSGGSWVFPTSDLHRALQRVLYLKRHGRRIASVNISLGSFSLFSGRCGNVDPTGDRLTRQLRTAGVAVIAAAGNNGVRGRMSWPACLPSVYAVSATNDRDRVAGFSNRGPKTSWWAPGVDVVAAVPGGPIAKGSASGTSMATPHVAGAFALLRECAGNTTPGAVATDLNATGRIINAGGIRRKRIDVFAAATRNVRNNRFARAELIPSFNVTDLMRSNVCASAERGEPGRVQNSVWFKWTARRKGWTTVSTNSFRRMFTTFNTEISVFLGTRIRDLRPIAYDNDGGVRNRSWLRFWARRGATYRIRVEGVRAQNGRFHLRLVPPGAG
jgi:subtilisin family serine protease